MEQDNTKQNDLSLLEKRLLTQLAEICVKKLMVLELTKDIKLKEREGSKC